MQTLTVLGRAHEESQRCASKRPVVEWRVTPLQPHSTVSCLLKVSCPSLRKSDAYVFQQLSMVTHLNSEDVEKLLDRFLREAGPTWPDTRGPSELLEALTVWNGMGSCTGPDAGLRVSVCTIRTALLGCPYDVPLNGGTNEGTISDSQQGADLDWASSQYRPRTTSTMPLAAQAVRDSLPCDSNFLYALSLIHLVALEDGMIVCVLSEVDCLTSSAQPILKRHSPFEQHFMP